MVRYAAEHKQATRRRILDAAGLRFRQDGLDGSGIAALMQDAGLTNGAFYAHFASKDDLIAHVLADQLREQTITYGGIDGGRDGLEQVIRDYLSPEHRDDRREGCPSAALLDEVARTSPEARSAYTEGVVALADAVAAHLDPESPQRLRVKMLSVVSTLVGTLQLARALDDAALSDQLLAEGLRNVRAILDSSEDNDDRVRGDRSSPSWE